MIKVHYRVGPYGSPLETCPSKKLTLLWMGGMNCLFWARTLLHSALPHHWAALLYRQWLLSTYGYTNGIQRMPTNHQFNHNQIG